MVSRSLATGVAVGVGVMVGVADGVGVEVGGAVGVGVNVAVAVAVGVTIAAKTRNRSISSWQADNINNRVKNMGTCRFIGGYYATGRDSPKIERRQKVRTSAGMGKIYYKSYWLKC